MLAIKNKVIIKSDGKDTTRESGIISNVSVTGGMRKGTIVSVGSQVKDLKAGDRVCWPVQEENPFEYKGEKFLWLYETQVFGFLENE